MLENLNKFIIFYVCSLLLATKAWAITVENEYFSSVAGLENLFKTEVQLLAEMQNYIYNLQQHIDVLQR